MTTIPYRGFKKEQFDSPVAVPQPRGARGTVATASLSSFHLPIAVTIEIYQTGACRFNFSYQGDEPAEKFERRLPSDDRISVSLGRHTGKVLAVTFEHALERLGSGGFSFNPEHAKEWWESRPPYQRFVCRESVNLVSRVLHTLPANLLEDMRSTLQRL